MSEHNHSRGEPSDRRALRTVSHVSGVSAWERGCDAIASRRRVTRGQWIDSYRRLRSGRTAGRGPGSPDVRTRFLPAGWSPANQLSLPGTHR